MSRFVKTKRDRRDRKLVRLLPNKAAPYDLNSLSKVETAVLKEAMHDGFGDVGVVAARGMPMPEGIKSGLLQHSYFVGRRSEYDPVENADDFWCAQGDRPPPSDFFPLGFLLRPLRIYFANQIRRFCSQNDHDATGGALDFDRLAAVDSNFIYSKPWYEFHAVDLIEKIEMTPQEVGFEGNRANLSLLLSSSFAGQLGRLVEQYYWRFQYEEAAVSGTGTRKGASAGGKIKAQQHLSQQASWQAFASEIWQDKPQLSKMAVATAIKKQLKIPQTAKNIARFITRPNRK